MENCTARETAQHKATSALILGSQGYAEVYSSTVFPSKLPQKVSMVIYLIRNIKGKGMHHPASL